MTFALSDVITIRGKDYTFIPDGRNVFVDGTGSRAHVYKLKSDGKMYALKVFKPEYQHEYSSANFQFFQQQLADIPAFYWVKQRILINQTEDSILITKYPHIENAILMPWLDYPTLDGLRKHITQTLTRQDKCRALAGILAHTLAVLEHRGIAHGDISISNVLINWDEAELYIIDIEEMFHASLTKPSMVPLSNGGTSGYRFRSTFTSWQPEADRFAGAILISEILTLSRTACRDASAEESYFTQDDLDRRFTSSIERFDTLKEEMQEITNGSKLIQLLEPTWRANAITDIPELVQWHTLLGQPNYTNLYLQWRPKPPIPVISTHAPSIPTPPPTPPIGIPQPVEYNRVADSDDPALIIFLLDLSRSMFRYKTADGQDRIELALELVNEMIRELINRSRKQDGIRPRYHLAVFGYHKHTIDILTPHIRIAGENNKKRSANTSSGIHPIGSLEDIVYDVDSIDQITPVKGAHPDGVTHMTQAFETIRKLLEANIATYQNSHPPYIFHITDGANNDHRNHVLTSEFVRISECKTTYGATLVSTLYIPDDLIDVEMLEGGWPGIRDETEFLPEITDKATLLRSISSKIPNPYLEYLGKNTISMQPGSYLFFPGASRVMIKLVMTVAKATGVISQLLPKPPRT